MKISFLGNVKDKRNIVSAFFCIKRCRFTWNSEQLFGNQRKLTVNVDTFDCLSLGHWEMPLKFYLMQDANEHFPVTSKYIKDVFVLVP